MMLIENEHKCKECKWLTGERTSVGVECMQPEKQEKWNNTRTLWMGELRRNVARYKQPSAPVCKKFEPKKGECDADINRSDNETDE